MRNIKIILEYDGAGYSGWQIQKNTSQTIQQKVQDVLTSINKTQVKVIGAGRTDKGVHAYGQTANFNLDVPIPVARIPRALNRLLPEDIVCRSAEEVEEDFHARYDAKGKKYRYYILNRKCPSAFKRNYVYHFIHRLDFPKIKKAAKFFEGTHDFNAFQSSGSSVTDTVRTIKSIELQQINQELIIEIVGNGFLYNMVRIIVGTLIEVGMGKIKLADVATIISEGNRKNAGFTVPAAGLFLVEVYY
ncbi:MAG: tRNA pseudouridine(38-40) synthase TruA [Halothermotrichaceae bacterium]